MKKLRRPAALPGGNPSTNTRNNSGSLTIVNGKPALQIGGRYFVLSEFEKAQELLGCICRDLAEMLNRKEYIQSGVTDERMKEGAEVALTNLQISRSMLDKYRQVFDAGTPLGDGKVEIIKPGTSV